MENLDNGKLEKKIGQVSYNNVTPELRKLFDFAAKNITKSYEEWLSKVEYKSQ